MCGRLDIIDDPLTTLVRELLGIDFKAETNRDLRPTQQVETVMDAGRGLHQQSTTWGIQPSWAKRLLINAKAETVAEKATFKRAFTEGRCLVPCSGWYEWRDEGGPRKRKYRFAHAGAEPLFMAAISYPPRAGEALSRIVTLTTDANRDCAPYHHRMPVLILPEDIGLWLEGAPVPLEPLLSAPPEGMIRVSAA